MLHTSYQGFSSVGDSVHKGAITSKIKHAIKLKTSPASLAGLVLSFIACFILLVIAA